MKYQGEKKCPSCGYPIYGYPAISRKDNKTEICSDCGTAEALSAYYSYLYSQKDKSDN